MNISFFFYKIARKIICLYHESNKMNKVGVYRVVTSMVGVSKFIIVFLEGGSGVGRGAGGCNILYFHVAFCRSMLCFVFCMEPSWPHPPTTFPGAALLPGRQRSHKSCP